MRALPSLGHPVPRANITIKQNATFSIGLCIIERDDQGNAVVVDTDGWEVVMQVRPRPDKGEPVLLEASTANGRVLTGIQGDPGEQVNIDIKIPPGLPGGDGTAGLRWFGCAGFDLLAIYPNGDHDYYLHGDALLQPAYSWERQP